jgi:hypothetical protein
MAGAHITEDPSGCTCQGTIMTGRIPFGLLTVLAALVYSPIQAQSPMGVPPENGVQPVGFHAFQDAGGPGQYHGIPLSSQRGPNGAPSGPTPPTMYEQLPDDPGFMYDDSPLGNMLTETFRHAWFRSEYLLWNISGPGNKVLGEQPLNGVTAINSANPLSLYGLPGNQSVGQGVQFARTVNGVAGIGMAPGLNDISIDSLNGFRGTFGVPLQSGQIELSAFILARSSDSFFGGNTLASVFAGSPGVGTGYIQTSIAENPPEVIGGSVGLDGLPASNGQTAQFITQPVYVNGVPIPMTASSAAIDYDVSYQARLTTSAWGTEGNFFLNSPDPNSIFQLRPSMGVRYFNFQDRLKQSGQYNEPTVANPTQIVSSNINSSANNDLFGPQVGLRAEATNSWFLIGVEPKIMLGMNAWKSTLDTASVFSATDPSQSLLSKGTTFSPLFDVKFYSNLALSKNLSAYVAYNYLWAGQVNRSYNNILYNQSAGGQSDFKLLRQYSGATLQGLSLGFELRF